MRNKKAVIELNMSTIVILVLAMSMLVLGLVLIRAIFEKSEKDFRIILDGEEVNEFVMCESNWNYQNKSFIPCIWEEEISGIPAEHINYSLSPQENCHFWNGTFPGFNINNATRNKELYDEVTPRCIWYNSENIDEEFLSGCEIEYYVDGENIKYKCSENLEIIKN